MAKVIFTLTNLTAEPNPKVGTVLLGIDETGAAKIKNSDGVISDLGGGGDPAFKVIENADTITLRGFNETINGQHENIHRVLRDTTNGYIIFFWGQFAIVFNEQYEYLDTQKPSNVIEFYGVQANADFTKFYYNATGLSGKEALGSLIYTPGNVGGGNFLTEDWQSGDWANAKALSLKVIDNPGTISSGSGQLIYSIGYRDDSNENVQFSYYDGASWKVGTIGNASESKFTSNIGIKLSDGSIYIPHFSNKDFFGHKHVVDGLGSYDAGTAIPRGGGGVHNQILINSAFYVDESDVIIFIGEGMIFAVRDSDFAILAAKPFSRGGGSIGNSSGFYAAFDSVSVNDVTHIFGVISNDASISRRGQECVKITWDDVNQKINIVSQTLDLFNNKNVGAIQDSNLRFLSAMSDVDDNPGFELTYINEIGGAPASCYATVIYK